MQRVLREPRTESVADVCIRDAPRSSILAAAARSGVVSKSQTMTNCSDMAATRVLLHQPDAKHLADDFSRK